MSKSPAEIAKEPLTPEDQETLDRLVRSAFINHRADFKTKMPWCRCLHCNQLIVIGSHGDETFGLHDGDPCELFQKAPTSCIPGAQELKGNVN
jgi:hypothetical protein